jgi:hypothetical protein
MAVEKFFEYRGFVGEGAAHRPYTFTAYRIPGQSAWFMKGRYMVDFGDAVVGVNRNSNDVGRAVIGDTGNKPEFGEGSFAFGQSINFLTGTFEPEVLYIVWPGTGVGQFTIPDPEVIQAMGGDLFEKFGGMGCVAQILTQIN